MIQHLWLSLTLLLLEIVFVVRALLRPHRSPASRIAWIVVIAVLPIAGILLYVLFGETNVGRRQRKRALRAQEKLRTRSIANQEFEEGLEEVPPIYRNVFRTVGSISGFPPLGGNRGELMGDSDRTIDRIVADIDAARLHVHLNFYIWLLDRNGLRVIDALERAARRGVSCRAMVDHLGSLELVRSEHWSRLAAAGVHTAIALPMGNPLLRVLQARIDLRNHRKIVVIDGRITYSGSQNCADAEFLPKRRFAPWVDAVIRFEGRIARQNQNLFAQDWMAHVDEDLRDLFDEPEPVSEAGFVAQAFGTGPTIRDAATPEVFCALLHAARSEVVITTPYFVPDETMLHALQAAGHRGVQCTLVLPARNDSWIVGAASRSYYLDLLDSNVRLFEFEGGLLHAKTFTVDGCITLIGSANLDRRSFDLNYENNVLLHDESMTREVKLLQEHYISTARPVSRQQVENWPLRQRLWANTVAMVSPLL